MKDEDAEPLPGEIGSTVEIDGKAYTVVDTLAVGDESRVTPDVKAALDAMNER